MILNLTTLRPNLFPHNIQRIILYYLQIYIIFSDYTIQYLNIDANPVCIQIICHLNFLDCTVQNRYVVLSQAEKLKDVDILNYMIQCMPIPNPQSFFSSKHFSNLSLNLKMMHSYLKVKMLLLSIPQKNPCYLALHIYEQL